jgi:hypothetical protein
MLHRRACSRRMILMLPLSRLAEQSSHSLMDDQMDDRMGGLGERVFQWSRTPPRGQEHLGWLLSRYLGRMRLELVVLVWSWRHGQWLLGLGHCRSSQCLGQRRPHHLLEWNLGWRLGWQRYRQP